MTREYPGLRADINAFLRASPDEHLTPKDAMLKFDVSRGRLGCVLCDMRKRGELAPGPTIRLPGVEA